MDSKRLRWAGCSSSSSAARMLSTSLRVAGFQLSIRTRWLFALPHRSHMRRHNLCLIAITFLLRVEGGAAPFILGQSCVQGIHGTLAAALYEFGGIAATFA